MTDDIIKKYGRKLLKDNHATGWSATLKPRIRNFQETEEKVFRVYVPKKKDLASLTAKERIPKILNGIPVDVVDIDTVYALEAKAAGKVNGRMVPIRPVPLGISISNWLVTSGTLGMLFTRDDAPGVIYGGGNAHVIAPDPFLPISSVAEKRIVQPGCLYGGKCEEDIVGKYVFHTQLWPTGTDNWGPLNWFGYIVWIILQYLRQVVGAKAQDRINYADFGVYETSVTHISQTIDDAVQNQPFIGLLLAGSSQVGIICKSKYIEAMGYKPVIPSAEVAVDDIVQGSSYWSDFTTRVFDESAQMLVTYDAYSSNLTDVVLVTNAIAPDGEPYIRGGCSGSGWRLIKKA